MVLNLLKHHKHVVDLLIMKSNMQITMHLNKAITIRVQFFCFVFLWRVEVSQACEKTRTSCWTSNVGACHDCVASCCILLCSVLLCNNSVMLVVVTIALRCVRCVVFVVFCFAVLFCCALYFCTSNTLQACHANAAIVTPVFLESRLCTVFELSLFVFTSVHFSVLWHHNVSMSYELYRYTILRGYEVNSFYMKFFTL